MREQVRHCVVLSLNKLQLRTLQVFPHEVHLHNQIACPLDRSPVSCKAINFPKVRPDKSIKVCFFPMFRLLLFSNFLWPSFRYLCRCLEVLQREVEDLAKVDELVGLHVPVAV